MNMRPKLSIPAQIADMKDAGISFEIFSEKDAVKYLEKHAYYFRLKAYAKNYEKYSDTDKKDRYINLDFAYLVDLSEIDALLRKVILDISMDLEYYLRVKLLSDFQIVDEDGYEIVRELFNMQPTIMESINDKANTSLSSDLVEKYKNNWAIWNIIEVLSLSQFTHLYGLFYSRNKFTDSHVKLLIPINKIRNAAAHGNCLINHFRPPHTAVISPSYELRNEVMQNTGVTKAALDKRLAHPAIHDFSALLYLYKRIVPLSKRLISTEKVKFLFYSRMVENKAYYTKNEVLQACYEFTCKIVDYYCDCS